MRSIPATTLQKGDVLALPFGKTATISTDPKVGTKFVLFRTEHGPTRVGRYEEVMVED